MSQIIEDFLTTARVLGHKMGPADERVLGNDRRVTYRCTTCGDLFTVRHVTPWRAGATGRPPEAWGSAITRPCYVEHGVSNIEPWL